MTLNLGLIGQSRQAQDLLDIDEQVLGEAIAQLCADDPAFRDIRAARSLGYGQRIAPLAFTARLWFRMVAAWPLTDPELGRKPGPNVLLAELTVSQDRPIFLGDRLGLRATLTDIKESRSGRYLVDIRSDVFTADREPVAVADYRFSIRRIDTAGEDDDHYR